MKLKCNKYNIILNNINTLNDYIDFQKYSKIFLLTDDTVRNNCYEKIYHHIPKSTVLISISTGEKFKNIDTAVEIWKTMVYHNADRKSLLVNFGGGMISDLGGFVASTYMRGIDFVNIPTTLLAMVDASIGGKNAINMNQIKNIVGTFNDPKMVFMDINFLNSLNKREYNSAWAEIIKHGIIADSDYFYELLNNTEDTIDIQKIIHQSLEIKKHIVESDFEEKNLRKTLNFGHTVGHAIESLSQESDNTLLHGEAIAIGMLIEMQIGIKINIAQNDSMDLIKKCLERYELNTHLGNYFKNKTQQLIDLMLKDKKNEDNAIKLALPNKIGNCLYNITVDISIVKSCIESFLHEIH